MAKKFIYDANKTEQIRKSRSEDNRTLIKTSGSIDKNAKLGKVIAAIGKSIIIRDIESSQLYNCTIGGTLITDNYKSSLVVVGDNIYFKIDNCKNNQSESELPSGVITAVQSRNTMLSRKAPGKSTRELVIASNADYLLLIVSAESPRYNLKLIDRFLVTAELGGLKAAICINKIDLIDDFEYIECDFEIYKKLGHTIFFISALNQDLIELKNFLQNKVTVFSGPSGVGKSTLINNIIGEEVQAVQEISERTNKGQHTTSSVKMFELQSGISIIDTPGIREFAPVGLEKNELCLYYHEFDNYFPQCKFPGCSHIHEPGCAVILAVENDDISLNRYESYVNFYSTLE